MVDLPKGVHRVIARGREYFYYHPGRGTDHAGDRVRLPDDPTDPAFWTQLRMLQGHVGVTTFGDVLDLYETSPQFAKLSDGTKEQYGRQIKIARAGFGAMAADAVRSSMIRGVVDGLSDTPGAANNFLGVMRAVSAWGVTRDHFPASISEGVEPFDRDGGHKPWTEAQIQAAHTKLTGMVRRGVLLALYTGQRGSDMVRLGWTDLDEGGFRIVQRKTKREVWCPVVDELSAEMKVWEKRPGPFVYQDGGRAHGRPYTRKLFSKHFDEVRDQIPELAGTTLHGLRSTAVIRLRRHGLATAQIQDIIGMSMAMIERYSRFSDKKASGKAAVFSMNRSRA